MATNTSQHLTFGHELTSDSVSNDSIRNNFKTLFLRGGNTFGLFQDIAFCTVRLPDTLNMSITPNTYTQVRQYCEAQCINQQHQTEFKHIICCKLRATQ